MQKNFSKQIQIDLQLKNSTPEFVLDANVFIEAHRRYYTFDICPGFWNVILEKGPDRLISIDKVKDELLKGDDELEDWVKTKIVDTHFASTDGEEVTDCYTDVMKKVKANHHYLPRAKSEFAKSADGWIAAYAYTTGAKVVTHEVFDPKIKKRVKLPNVCHELGVDTVDTFALLRELEAVFILQRDGLL